jgi:diguanylate cyclase (GGDEF)-like protein
MSDSPTVAVTKSGVSLLQDFIGHGPRRPCLILYSGGDAGMPFDLEPGAYAIGRAPECHLQLDNPGISRRHAELRVDADAVVIADLGSSNGTYVNETRVTGPQVLRSGDMVRLGVVVLRFYESQSLEAALHDRIYRTATVDPGTDVFNRRYLFDTLKREMRLAREQSQPLAVLCYDLDHFKNVNDRWGHAAGDVVLRDSAAVAREALKGIGVLGRLGGEEFGAVLPHTALADAAVIAEHVRAAMAGHVFRVAVDGQSPVEHRQTISIGVAALGPDTPEPAHLLAAADRLLYASKNGGRNRVSVDRR